MLRTLLFISPLYVTLFWLIVLNTNADKNSPPRAFLGKFMIFASVVYFSHFLFFASLKEFYVWVDALYQYASLMVYPLYYIYFRLLTVDERFSFSKHARYLLPSTILFLFYVVGILLAPKTEYKMWVFQKNLPFSSVGIQWLSVVYVLIKAVFIIQVVLTVTANSLLIRKYGYKAAQYYSNMHDTGTINVNLLNLSMILTAVASITIAILGRDYFENNTFRIGFPSVIFSALLFVIGWLGNRQKPINPAYEVNQEDKNELADLELNSGRKAGVLHKIQELFEQKKVYLRSSLTIQEVADCIGTNRTYISSVINEFSKQNFSAFVNQYRLQELEKILRSGQNLQAHQLAELTGFGSVDSMKRALKMKTNKSLTEWKEEIIKQSHK